MLRNPGILPEMHTVQHGPLYLAQQGVLPLWAAGAG